MPKGSAASASPSDPNRRSFTGMRRKSNAGMDSPRLRPADPAGLPLGHRAEQEDRHDGDAPGGDKPSQKGADSRDRAAVARAADTDEPVADRRARQPGDHHGHE